MDDEKRKKRNKKKKNKQIKHAEDAVAPGEATSTDLHPVPIDDARTAQNAPHPVNASGAAAETEAEKDESLTNEAVLEDTIKQLRDENYSHLQKEAVLEETVRHLKNENEAHIEKEATLEESLVHLRKENDVLAQQMCSLENKMRQLLDERSTFTQKEVSLEEKLRQLERDRESWLAVERSSKETISSLNDEITILQAQVLDLEESRSNLLDQNKSLLGTVSNLQVQIQNHERNTPSADMPDGLEKGASEEELNSQIEAACTLVEKLITENAELVEKVNELCIKLNQQSMLHRVSSSSGNDSLPAATETMKLRDPSTASAESLQVVVQKSESLEEIPIHDEVIHSYSNGTKDIEPALVNTKFPVGETEETVPVSVNPNGDVDMESQVVAGNDEEAVPITDAPLVGAPFRLVSFVARYVSGADLVEKKTLISRY